MATEIVTRNGETVAVRFYGGRARGRVVQMEIAPHEFEAWKDQEVLEGGDGPSMRLEDWLAGQDAAVEWDSAARQNALAREIEQGRHADVPAFRALAAERRGRAALLARLSIQPVEEAGTPAPGP